LVQIASIGSCGAPKVLEFPNSGDFHGRIVHSSELDSFNTSLAGKKVVIIGSGASGVEAAEAAINKGSTEVVLLARDDKWIIPRNTIFDIMLALQPWGRETVSIFTHLCELY
jgi:dimethylaniline monooxygenase (N-oxide forming)